MRVIFPAIVPGYLIRRFKTPPVLFLLISGRTEGDNHGETVHTENSHLPPSGGSSSNLRGGKQPLSMKT